MRYNKSSIVIVHIMTNALCDRITTNNKQQMLWRLVIIMNNEKRTIKVDMK